MRCRILICFWLICFAMLFWCPVFGRFLQLEVVTNGKLEMVTHAVSLLKNGCTTPEKWVHHPWKMGVLPLKDGGTTSEKWVYWHLKMGAPPLKNGCTTPEKWVHHPWKMGAPPLKNGYTATERWGYYLWKMSVLTLKNGCTSSEKWVYCHLKMGVLPQKNGCTSSEKWVYCLHKRGTQQRKKNWSLRTPLCETGSVTTEHLLPACPLHDSHRCQFQLRNAVVARGIWAAWTTLSAWQPSCRVLECSSAWLKKTFLLTGWGILRKGVDVTALVAVAVKLY